MLTKLKQIIKQSVSGSAHQKLTVKWVKKNSHSWLSQQMKADFIKPQQTAFSSTIEKLARETNQSGPQPLWNGYAENNIAGPTRMPDEVRTAATMGNFYTFLVQALQPNIIVEFGTAFGVSGMYFLAGIESNHKGQLLTFEPNDVWRNLAVRNLSRISDRFQSTAGTFEENIDKVLPQGQGIDLAFIDAIHSKEFVIPQLEIVMARSSDKAIIILDDINFSASMRECWEAVSNDRRFLASAALDERVGILELNKSRKD